MVLRKNKVEIGNSDYLSSSLIMRRKLLEKLREFAFSLTAYCWYLFDDFGPEALANADGAGAPMTC